MEASSHGLVQGRLEGCGFDAVGFSNLTPEHLEYHKDMEGYFAAKRRLFANYARGAWRGAVNADDAYGARLIDEFRENALAFSGDDSREGVYRFRVLEEKIDGMTVAVTYPDGSSFSAGSPLVGKYNASNILEGAVLGDSLGFDAYTIKEGIERCPQVPGRLERHFLENGVTVFVDYAHSADGMAQALGTLKRLASGKIRVLWGAGGDRTPLKRPITGEIMAKLADHVVISTDNPRGEDPAEIARMVESGVKKCAGSVRCDTILDRGEAINFILDSARPGEIVLIAGKGPERFIDYGTRRVYFVDSEHVLEWTRAHSAGAREP
jgi:UDP-N-acetylmuramoyl-L-alanyl-D-glutamate--2,6-diaminopimelate ligase